MNHQAEEWQYPSVFKEMFTLKDIFPKQILTHQGILLNSCMGTSRGRHCSYRKRVLPGFLQNASWWRELPSLRATSSTQTSGPWGHPGL